MVHRVDGPIGVYRGFDDGTDARIAEINAELAARDDLPVPVLAREAPRARVWSCATRWSSRTPSIRRSSTRRRPRAARGKASPADRDELVGQPAQGRRRARAGSTATSTTRATRSPSRVARPEPSSTFASSALSTPRRSPTSSARRTSTSPRAATTRARTRSSRRSRAAFRRPTATAAATPSSSARAAFRSHDDEELGEVLERLVVELDERRAAISTRPIAWVADRYLEVLGLDAGT